jgi:hypothetical protein
MLKRVLTPVLILIPMLVALAEFNISGNILVRPRYNLLENFTMDDSLQSSDVDLYWLYRARMDFKITVDNGYLVAAQLGHDSPVQLSIMGEPGQSRTDWILAYAGKRFSRGELYAGHIPLTYTPLLDLHNYPDLAANLPWLALDHVSVTGIKGSLSLEKTGFRGFFALDEDNSFQKIDSDSTTTWRDGFSCGVSQQLQLGNFKLEPQFYYSDNRTTCNGVTAGLSAQTVLAGFTIKATAGLTQAENDKYRGTLYHFEFFRKLGPGSLHFFHNYSPISYDGADDVVTRFIWLDYTWNIMESDDGCVYVRPTWRWFKKDQGTVGYSVRNRFELTLVMEVK